MQHRSPVFRLLRRPCGLVAVCAAILLAAAGLGLAQTGDAAGDRVVLRADIVGPIGPASVRYLATAIDLARARDAEVLILRMNTPGGLADSMREMITSVLSSPVPVVGYVAPPGAHAASAGTYILYATHVAAMAPGTNIGAATPVRIGGGLPGLAPDKDKDSDKDSEDKSDGNGARPDKSGSRAPSPGSAMEHKATNDAVAFIRSLAELRGRNVEWAEKAVREAATLSATQAADLNVIDFVAADQDALLAMLDGRTVTAGSAERTLKTKDATVEAVAPGFVTKLLGVLSNPNIAFILMLIGIYGIIFELANPGSIGPGLLGAICLVLALYALNQLPLDYAGLALVMLGIALMVIEALTPAFGVVGIAGIVSFMIGATFLIDSDVPAFQLSWAVIIGTAAVSGALLVLLLGYVWRTHKKPPAIGPQRVVGSTVEVIDWSDGEGHVWLEGERWNARGGDPIEPGAAARVIAVNGLTLEVASTLDAPSSSNRK